MLILQRRSGESVHIGEDIEVTVVAIECGKVRLAISAPRDITILRSELIGARDTNRDAAASTAPLTVLDALLPAIGEPQQSLPLKQLKPNGVQK